MTISALPRDLDAIVEILARATRDRPASGSCKGAACCGNCVKLFDRAPSRDAQA